MSQRARAPSCDGDDDEAMSREVELERPARVEQQRERVVQQPPNGDDELVVEKEEQCVCQICTCGKHRCRSASSESSVNGAHEVLQQRAGACCEKEAGRRQWEISPDRVRQISKSYRSIERQDDASETTTVSEQRHSKHECSADCQVFHSEVHAGAKPFGHDCRKHADEAAKRISLAGEHAMAEEDLDALRAGENSEIAARRAAEERSGSKASQHVHSTSRASDSDQIQGRIPSRYRPKTSLRLEGAQEYTTTSSEYFSTIEQNLTTRAEQYTVEKELAATGSRHYPLTRPQTSLRTGGKTHYSTTTSEDFKLREQSEKVTRRLRPRKFNDPSYDIPPLDVEADGDVKKRRTEVDFTGEEQGAGDGVLEGEGTRAAQEISQDQQTKGTETHVREELLYSEEHHDEREMRRVHERKGEHEVLHSFGGENLQRADRPLTTMNAEPYLHTEVPVPFYPKDNLGLSSGEMDLRTTHEMEYYKKKMDRVRPVKPKSLSKLFGSTGSSSEGDLKAAASSSHADHVREKSPRMAREDLPGKQQAAGLTSDYEDSKMHLGLNNILIKRKSKGQKKAHFQDESFKWEGPVSYATTMGESYKKPDATRERAVPCKRPQSHDVLHRFTQTGDELRRIKGKKKGVDEISLFGRKDSAELIAEIQGLLGTKATGRTESKVTKQESSARKKAGLETSLSRERGEQAAQTGTWHDLQQEQLERARGQQKSKAVLKKGDKQASRLAEHELAATNLESTEKAEKRCKHLSAGQHVSDSHVVSEVSTGRQEYLQSSATTKIFEEMDRKRARVKDDVRGSEEIIAEGDKALGSSRQDGLSTEADRLAVQRAERPLESRYETGHVSRTDGNKLYFSTTTAESFKNVSEKVQPAKPFYPKPNLAPEGSMTFETVHHGEFTPKTVVEVPTPVRPVSTLRLSDDTSYVVRNEDKIGYSKRVPLVGDTRFAIKKPESTLVLGQDSTDYKTTSQLEYKAHEIRQVEDVYKKATKVKRDRHKTYTRAQPAAAASKSTGMQRQHRRSLSSAEHVTTTQAAFKPVTVERPQPYRPKSCLKVRSEDDAYVGLSTTTRDTFRRVTPTARVKPIKREACLKKLGDDTDYTPKRTTTGDAYREVKIPPKPVPYRPTDNLKNTGGMTFSTTTQESYVSRASQQHTASEFAERARPIKRDAVAKDIIFPVDSPEGLVQGATTYGLSRKTEESMEVLRSLENTSSYARISKAPRERPRTHQKVGRGEFDHMTTSMAEYQDPGARWRKQQQRSTAAGRLVRTASAECPAAFLNTDRSEYVFKEVIGNHRFYLPAVQ